MNGRVGNKIVTHVGRRKKVDRRTLPHRRIMRENAIVIGDPLAVGCDGDIHSSTLFVISVVISLDRSMMYWYLAIIYSMQILPSSGLKFETSCHSSQFYDLENLIGSLHAHEPNFGHLNVRDAGVTSGQRQLLQRYQNVQIISLEHAQTDQRQIINVTDEFLTINRTLYTRYNQGRHPHVDSIRKRFSLAIVVPFIHSQLSKLIHRLELDRAYSPCKEPFESVDLIFYYNEKYDSQVDQQLQRLDDQHTCFRTIRYLAADLSKEDDRYPIGSAIMWKMLLIDEQTNNLSLRSYGYTHFFLLEPDARPIRPYWLDAIVEEITDGHPIESYRSSKWWMIGSVYRGLQPIGIHFLHINANALSHLSSSFIRFVERVIAEYPFDSRQSLGYDLDLFSYLLKDIDRGKEFWHKFRFSELIQNCWHTGCNDTTENFPVDNPNTYLIHGSRLTNKPANSSLNNPFLIVSILLWLLFLSYIFRRAMCQRVRLLHRRMFL